MSANDNSQMHALALAASAAAHAAARRAALRPQESS